MKCKGRKKINFLIFFLSQQRKCRIAREKRTKELSLRHESVLKKEKKIALREELSTFFFIPLG
jgi:hypothetical protein